MPLICCGFGGVHHTRIAVELMALTRTFVGGASVKPRKQNGTIITLTTGIFSFLLSLEDKRTHPECPPLSLFWRHR